MRFNVLKTLEMPVILCNSFENVYWTTFNEEDGVTETNDNFQLEVDYAYIDKQERRKNEYFLIDVVSLGMLDSFIKLLEQDVRSVSNFVG